MQKKINEVPAAPRFSFAKCMADQFLINHHANRLPFQPEQALKDIGCKIVTYTEFARINNTTLDDVANVMGSNDGRTVLWKQSLYIVFINDTISSNARKRWTLAHELSHIILHHLEDYNARQVWIASSEESRVLDREANACASELMSPTSVLYYMGCRKRNAIREVCDISYKAAGLRQNFFDSVSTYRSNCTEKLLLAQFSDYMNKNVIA